MLFLNTVADFETAIAKHCNGFGNHPAKDVRDVRFSKLTSEEVQTLNDFVVKNAEYYVVPKPSLEILFAILGLVEAGTESPFISVGDKSYIATRNKYNRRRTESRIGPVTKPKTYANFMLRKLWATNYQDPWAIDCFTQAISLQHRCKAGILALLAGGELPPIVLAIGVPKQFKDLADKSKSRSKIDDSATDPETLPQSLVDYIELSVGGELTAPKRKEKVRQDLVKLRSTLCGMLAQRMSGKDITSTGVKQDFDEESEVVELFGTVELEDLVINQESGATLEGGTYYALDWLCCKVYEAGKSGDKGEQKKSHLKLFANSILATALALASNDEKAISERVKEQVGEKVVGETVEEYSDRLLETRQAVLTSNLTIDTELVDKVLGLVTSTTIEFKNDTVESFGGPLGQVLKNLFEYITSSKAKVGEKKLIYGPTSVPAMSAMVQLVKNIAQDDMESDIYTKYTMRDGKYSPEYRSFGGIDIGYTDRKNRSKE